MNFKINRDLLLSNLNDVTKALSTKPQQPISTGIKIEVKQNEIVLLASNSEIAIESHITKDNNLVIYEEGVTVLPGKYLFDIVRKSDDKELTFTSFEGNIIKITSSRSEFSMNSMDIEAFPIISFDCNGNNYTTDALAIKDFIRKTAFAAGVNDDQAVLTGVNFLIKNNRAEAIATDRYRLAKKYISSSSSEVNVIFRAKSLDDLSKVLDDSNDVVNVNISQTKAVFTFKNIKFRCRLISGNYPNTEPLIPHDFLTELSFDKQNLINAIERVSLFNSQVDDSIVKLSLKEDGEVEISSINNEIGAVNESITPMNATNIVPFQIAFSFHYLLDAVKAFDSSKITISFTGELKPFIISGEYDTNCIQLIVPVRA